MEYDQKYITIWPTNTLEYDPQISCWNFLFLKNSFSQFSIVVPETVMIGERCVKVEGSRGSGGGGGGSNISLGK
jgi:hypothetical protein